MKGEDRPTVEIDELLPAMWTIPLEAAIARAYRQALRLPITPRALEIFMTEIRSCAAVRQNTGERHHAR